MPDISGEYAGHWWRRFWWIRGVIAALTLTALVPNLVDLSRYDFLRAFHLIIIGWSELMGWVGVLVGQIPLIPELSADTVNLIILLSVFSPAVIAGILYDPSVVSTPEADLRLSKGEPFRRKILIWLIGFGIIVAFSVFLPMILFKDLDQTIEILLGEDEHWVAKVAIIGGFLLLFRILFRILERVPGFLTGVFYFVTFVVTLEVLFVLNTPGLASWIDIKHCELKANDSSICKFIEAS